MNRQRDLRLVVAGQFLGALADSALLMVAIALLMARQAPEWAAPALRFSFYLSYVLLGAVSGALADAFPKRNVLTATNLAKLGGCALLALHVHPLAAFALVGLGAAAHSSAKYGILGEIDSSGGLVRSNAWIEIATVAAMLLGVVLGSELVNVPLTYAIGALAALYAAAAACSALVGKQAASDPRALREPLALLQTFATANATLWRDSSARVSLAVTSLFWAAAAVLQFIVIRWGMEALHLTLSQAGLLQGAVAVGMVAGAAAAGRWVSPAQVMRVLPLGLALGAGVAVMAFVTGVVTAAALLGLIGTCAGLLVVPMNALLQQRGQALLHPGQAVSVQAFAENGASLVMLGVYGALVLLDVPVWICITGLGAVVCALTALCARSRHQDQTALPNRAIASSIFATSAVAKLKRNVE